MSDSRRYRSILPIGKATSVANSYITPIDYNYALLFIYYYVKKIGKSYQAIRYILPPYTCTNMALYLINRGLFYSSILGL
jgi:hypothetical protein